MSLLIKCLFGALTVLIIALISKTKNYYLAGLAPLFPTFALIAHYIVFTERSASHLKSTALFGIWSLIPYFVYLLVVYLLCEKHRLYITLSYATIAWCITALLLIYIWNYFYLPSTESYHLNVHPFSIPRYLVAQLETIFDFHH